MQSIFYLPAILTDHSALFFSIASSHAERGASYWKFSNSHLEKIDFLNGMNKWLEAKITEYAHLPAMEKWEHLIFGASNYAQEWSREYAQEKNFIKDQLFDKVSELEEQIIQ